MSVVMGLSRVKFVVILFCSLTVVNCANCPSLLREDQAIWRSEVKAVQVSLDSSKIACVFGDTCANRAEHQTVIHINAQLGDSISLNIVLEDIADHNATDVVVATVGQTNCEIGDVVMALNQTYHVMLRENDNLKAGNQLLLVKLSDTEYNCTAIWKLNISLSRHECSRPKEQELCSNTGYCGEKKDSNAFSCNCCPGYIGKYCEERNACYDSPCQHGGFCVDIAEGHSGTTYQCLCPHGYRGKSCEGEVSLCDRKPCQNEGTCHGNQTHYSCLCPRGFTGVDCAVNVNECLSNPCIHGVCEDGVGGYRCYCLPGYGGDHCEFEYDECDSSPCINGGACEDLVAGYRCHCGAGYRGNRCQIKVDLCTPNPCPAPAQCVDRGNNYTCICRPGHSSSGCTQHYDPCYPNPCQHGGTCWPSLDSYFCSCTPGYTGDLCEGALYPLQPLPRTLDDPGEPEETERKREDDHAAQLDHWHTVYIAGTMLTLAGTLVVLGAVVCHCRTHNTCVTLSRTLSRSCSDIKQQKIPRQSNVESPWERF